MSGAAALPALPAPSMLAAIRRQPRWLLVAMHVPFFAFTAAQGVTGMGMQFATPRWFALPLLLLAAAIQLRHSLAAASGTRPRHWPWSMLALLLIAYLPLSQLGDRWLTMQWYVLASLGMLLPPRAALWTTGASAILFALPLTLEVEALTAGQIAWVTLYRGTVLVMGGGGLYGAARLVRLIDELDEARGQLAELAIGSERLRISRDLHDLLGQSLSAVSLKADLAIALLGRRQVPRAAAEIESLVSFARSALHDLRDVAHRETPSSLAAEMERAADLLTAAGIETRVEIALGSPPRAADDLLGRVLREGVTNVLRHSAATSCAISAWRDDGMLRMEIVNDGTIPGAPGGTGLSGLAARAAALSGSASGESLSDGRFRLSVQIPEREVAR